MSVNRQQLHDIIDIVDAKELSVLYRVLIKFVPEDDVMPDEIEAISKGREEIRRGDKVSHESINWD